MSDPYERDPEGATLRILSAAIANVAEVARHARVTLADDPRATFTLEQFSREQVVVLARAYNNLLVLYRPTAPRRLVTPRRFVRRTFDQPAPPACEHHCALAVTGGRSFLTYTNDFTLVEDVDVAFTPKDPTLAALMQMFEASLPYRASYRLAEVVALAETGDAVWVVDREFVNDLHYTHLAARAAEDLAARRAMCARRIGCTRCCPCVATQMLSLVANNVALAYPRAGDRVVVPPVPLDPVRAITTRTCASYDETRQRAAMMWFFARVQNPLGAFWRVCSALTGGTVEDAIGLVQETAVRTFILLELQPELADRVQRDQVAPALRAGLLYDYRSGNVVTSCALASAAAAAATTTLR